MIYLFFHRNINTPFMIINWSKKVNESFLRKNNFLKTVQQVKIIYRSLVAMSEDIELQGLKGDITK